MLCCMGAQHEFEIEYHKEKGNEGKEITGAELEVTHSSQVSKPGTAVVTRV